MQSLSSQAEYGEIVTDVAVEKRNEVASERALAVANACVATFIDLGVAERTYTVTTDTSLYGSPIEALEDGPLNPYDIIRYSDRYPTYVAGGQTDDAAAVASNMLALDLQIELNQTNGISVQSV